MNKKSLITIISIGVLILSSSCSSMREYTAIAKSELTPQMLENPLRLPLLSEGVEQNVVLSPFEHQIDYNFVYNSLASGNLQTNNTDWSIVTYSANTANYNMYGGINTSNVYRYRVRKSADVSVGMDKLVVEEHDSNKTLLAVTGVVTGLCLFLIILMSGSAQSQ